MRESERRAIVWDLIEQLAFRPLDKGKSWLRCYSKQLNNLLQLDPIWINDGSEGRFQIEALGIACEYKIEGENAYLAFLEETENQKTIWSTHTDSAYLSKAALHMSKPDYPEIEIETYLRSDITSVLEGMLFHPRNHSHLSDVGFTTAGDLDPSCKMLKANEIRVSSAAYNGFVFLYHVAFQLCVVSKNARVEEKTRLICLFENAIRNKKKVNPGDLFNFKQ